MCNQTVQLGLAMDGLLVNFFLAYPIPSNHLTMDLFSIEMSLI